jgi:hypothetical protein
MCNTAAVTPAAARPRRRAAWATAAIALAATQLGASECGGNIIRDPGFDLWCGEALCAWKIERGDIRPAPTWHEADTGVELLSTGTAIEQFSAVNSHDGTCIQFDLISDVAETAQAELAVDVYGDGSVERTFPLPTAHWQPVSYRFAIKPPFTGVRFELAKRGPGRAVVARMRAKVAETGCDGVPALDGGPAPLAAFCDAATDCASGICSIVDFFGTQRCTGCVPFKPGSCTAGQVCGYSEPGAPERGVPIACVAAADRELGEQCLTSAECASSICAAGFCSSCDPTKGCASGACDQPYPIGPYICAPNQHTGASGSPCVTGADCAGGACDGAERRQCIDGRACATDANCPVDGNLIPGPCTAVGVQGGSCD